MRPNIMIIGGSGRLGVELIRRASTLSSAPTVHAFVRTPSKLPPAEAALCATVQKGDALSRPDISRALHATGADVVVVAVGVPNSTEKSDVREKSAKALMAVVKPGGRFDRVRVVVVSSVGAGDSNIKLGWGVGALLSFHLRHVLSDHDMQEETFVRGFGSKHVHRLLIVRPTSLTDDHPKGKVTTFGHGKAPTAKIARADVADYILAQVCGEGSRFGNAVNITSAKK